MTSKHYYISKKNENGSIIYVDYNKLKGFDFSPKNNVKYEGIIVNKMVIINPSMIEKLLRKKIQKKLELYLKLIIKLIDDESDDGESLKEALNDLTRYKSIIAHKYKKYLDKKYMILLNKKISVVEYELKKRLVNCINNKSIEEHEEVKESHRHR